MGKKLNNYRNGRSKEYRIMDKFRKKDCVVLRSAGSHSIIDVVAIDPLNSKIYLIQSKVGDLSKPQKERILMEGSKLTGKYEVLFELWN
jgi:hypothetical protein